MNWINIGIWMLCLFPIWGTLLWEIWQGVVRPVMIPRHEIIVEIEALLARDDGRGFEIACIEEQAAWYRSNTFEQGKWRQVREEIMRNYGDKITVKNYGDQNYELRWQLPKFLRPSSVIPATAGNQA